jgi:anti-sigma B factor antagonist
MFTVRAIPDGTVHLVGRLDAAEVPSARLALDGLQGPLTLDCSELDYVSSAGIGLLVETYKRLHQAGQSLRLVNLLPRVRNVFAYAGLDRVLTLE